MVACRWSGCQSGPSRVTQDLESVAHAARLFFDIDVEWSTWLQSGDIEWRLRPEEAGKVLHYYYSA